MSSSRKRCALPQPRGYNERSIFPDGGPWERSLPGWPTKTIRQLMMKPKREVERAFSAPPEPSNRPTPFPGNSSQRMIPRRSSGWDPYEVWRTRVKEPRESKEGDLLDSAG